jgi:predicted nucleic acid-binding Zn ribbon protein
LENLFIESAGFREAIRGIRRGFTVAEKLLQHKHCINCGRAVKAGNEYCDEDCRDEHVQMIKKKRRQLLTLYAGSIVVVIVLVLFSMGGTG